VPHFDSNWQITYAYKNPPVFPAGTVLHQTSWHDNSAANKRNPDPTNMEIREGIAGNLCRCTGYVNIVKAIEQAAAELRAPATSDAPAEPAAAS